MLKHFILHVKVLFFNILFKIEQIIFRLSNNNYIIALFPFSIFDFSSIIPNNITDIQKFIFSIIILLIITLWCFIDIVGHFIVLYLIDYSKLENKYPIIKPILNYFKKINYILLTFEIIFFIIIYIIIISLLIYFLYLIKIL
jgi:hypothetical protein